MAEEAGVALRSRARRRTRDLAAALIGALAFLLVCGPGVLWPTRIAWLATGDPAMFYLGWSFFRRSPWTWPPSANPDYGLELASSIFFADAIPLLALSMKTIAPAGGPWQYFGIWLLVCFALQGLLAGRLAALYTPSRLAQLLAAALFCFAPIFLWRLHGHYALNAHWLLLAGLWLCLRPLPSSARAWRAWALLVAAAALIHAYLLAMVLALWAADLVRRAIFLRPRRVTLTVIEPGAAVLAAASALWLGGFFALPGGVDVAGGFGFYRANLLSPLDSDGWSFVWPDVGGGAGDYEGFAFLGSGVLLLVLAALTGRAAAVRRDGRAAGPTAERWPLAAVLVVLVLFALSHRWAFGPWEVAVLPLPAPLARAGALLRSSGRMLWPAVYVLMLWGVVAVVRALPGRSGCAVVALATALQAVDTAPGWRRAAAAFAETGTSWASPLRHPFWAEAAGTYRLLRWIPTADASPHWPHLSYFALTHGMATDAVHLARISGVALIDLQRRGRAAVATGAFDRETLYVLDEPSAAAAAEAIDPKADLLVRLDGLNVLAPGWLGHSPMPTGAVPISRLARTGP